LIVVLLGVALTAHGLGPGCAQCAVLAAGLLLCERDKLPRETEQEAPGWSPVSKRDK
jgi:hypothetical protein